MNNTRLLYAASGSLIAFLVSCSAYVTPAEKPPVNKSQAYEEPPLGRAYNSDMDSELVNPHDALHGYGFSQSNGMRDSVAVSTYNTPSAPTATPAASGGR